MKGVTGSGKKGKYLLGEIPTKEQVSKRHKTDVAFQFLKILVDMESNCRKRFPQARSARKETIRT